MMKKVENNSLLKQSNALGNYLDEMLHDATRIAEEADTDYQPVKLESPQRAFLSEVAIIDVIEPDEVIEPEASNVVDVSNIIEIDERVAADAVPEVEVEVEVEAESEPASKRLDISDFPLQCLMFRVGNNLLSLPLIQMNGVLRWTDELTQLPGSPDWVLGILTHRDTNLRVLDSSKVLGIPAIEGQTPGHILLFADSRSAISCDLVENVVTLEYDDIKWQPEAGNTIMHGTIRDTLAYLLNPPGIIDSLNITSEL